MGYCYFWQTSCQIDTAGWAGALANLLVVVVTVWLALRSSSEATELRRADHTRALHQALTVLNMSLEIILTQLLPLRRTDDDGPVAWVIMENAAETALSTLNIVRASEIPDAELMRLYNGTHILAETVLRNARNLPNPPNLVNNISGANEIMASLTDTAEYLREEIMHAAKRLGFAPTNPEKNAN